MPQKEEDVVELRIRATPEVVEAHKRFWREQASTHFQVASRMLRGLGEDRSDFDIEEIEQTLETASMFFSYYVGTRRSESVSSEAGVSRESSGEDQVTYKPHRSP